MNHRTTFLAVPLALAGLSTSAECRPATGADSPGETQAEFAAPRKLRAGEAFAGHGRLYPSPILHDVDGDGHVDVVIGDLFGRVTWAKASASKPGTFEAEQPLKMSDGEPLKFDNW